MKITGATLLSVEEARQLDKEILKASDNWWWLRSPSIYDKYYNQAACVIGGDGCVYDDGLVEISVGVRPALCISNLSSSDLKIGDKFTFGDRNFIIISDKYALCDEVIGRCAFRKDWEAKDANSYEASDVKVFVDQWFDRTKEFEMERAKEDNLNKARQLWDELADVPIDPETECIESDWKQFPAGTHREEIWHWFEDTFDVSVAEDLMYTCEEPER